MSKQIWFKRRWFGWGWYPSTWQGYAITFAYVISIMLLALTLDENSPVREVFFMFILPFILLTITLIRICYAKGESPRWQWGKPKDEDTKS